MYKNIKLFCLNPSNIYKIKVQFDLDFIKFGVMFNKDTKFILQKNIILTYKTFTKEICKMQILTRKYKTLHIRNRLIEQQSKLK